VTVGLLNPVLAAEGGGSSLLLPDTAELVWGLVSFAILMAFMSRYVFPRLTQMLDERASRIQGQMEEAESTRAEAERLRSQYEEQLSDARNQASEIIEDAKAQGERQRENIIANANQEAEQIKSRAREDAEAERQRLVQDLRDQVGALSVELAGKIVQRELDQDRHRELVDQYINQLAGRN
jgi:F-type H+-transporting ATPase subunit b